MPGGDGGEDAGSHRAVRAVAGVRAVLGDGGESRRDPGQLGGRGGAGQGCGCEHLGTDPGRRRGGRAEYGLRRSSRARGFAPTPRPVHIRRVAQGAHLRRLHDELHGRHDPVAGRARRRAGHRAPRAGHVLHHTAPPMPRRRVLGRRGRAGPRGWRGDARVFLRHRRARAPGRPAVRERPRRAHRRGIGRGERGG